MVGPVFATKGVNKGVAEKGKADKARVGEIGFAWGAIMGKVIAGVADEVIDVAVFRKGVFFFPGGGFKG